MITSAMNQLPPEEARILTLFYLAELSVSETGAVLGLTETNTKVRLLRARQKLKQVLETQYARELDY
jgi:RNA polymerase sigma factor (sigma-70 family)